MQEAWTGSVGGKMRCDGNDESAEKYGAGGYCCFVPLPAWDPESQSLTCSRCDPCVDVSFLFFSTSFSAGAEVERECQNECV